MTTTKAQTAVADDPINAYFKKFYPASFDISKWKHTPMLGGMNQYVDHSISNIFPRITCMDGFSMSVQGHYGTYSHPRDDFAAHYTHVEVGFPSAREELLMEFAEEAERPTETVYGYVPVEVVAAVIQKHGGFRSATEA